MHLIKETIFSLLVGIGIIDASFNAPVLYLSMDKNAPTNVLTDSSGYQNHGKMVGQLAYTKDRFGNDCRALQFSGKGYIEIPNSNRLQLNEAFSCAVWLKLPAQQFQWVTLFCKGDNPAELPNSPAYRVQLTSSTASINTDSTPELGERTQAYPQNQWFHLAVVYTEEELQIFVDGKLQYTYALEVPIGQNVASLEIGRDIPGDTEFFEGIMDDFLLFPFAINASQVQKLALDTHTKNYGDACIPQQPKQNLQAALPSLGAIDLSNLQAYQQPAPILTPKANGVAQNDDSKIEALDLNGLVAQKAPTNNNSRNTAKTTKDPQAVIASSPNNILPPAEIDFNLVDIQGRIKIKTKTVTVRVYDHLIVDSDTISFYFNEQLLIQQEPILERKARKFEFKVTLSANQPNLFTVKAHNFGTSGHKVNTVTVEIDDYVNSPSLRKLNIKNLEIPAALEVTYKQ